jgi:Cu/Ag efflux pump CusA
MIAKLIDWCIRNRAMVLMLTLFLIVAGVWAVFNIKVDAIPDLSDVQVIIYTEYTGRAADRRGPGHLSAHEGDARGAEVEGGARL